MIRTQISLTENQMRRLRLEARRRHVSLAAIVRDAVDQVVPAVEFLGELRIGRALLLLGSCPELGSPLAFVGLAVLLAAAGSTASGSGTVARDHDAILGDDRW